MVAVPAHKQGANNSVNMCCADAYRASDVVFLRRPAGCWCRLGCARTRHCDHRTNLSRHTAAPHLPTWLPACCCCCCWALKDHCTHPRVWWLARVTGMPRGATVVRWPPGWGHEWRRPRKATRVWREAPWPAWGIGWGSWWWPKTWEAWRIGSPRPWGPRVLCWGWPWKGRPLLLLRRPATEHGSCKHAADRWSQSGPSDTCSQARKVGNSGMLLLLASCCCLHVSHTRQAQLQVHPWC